jgi:hypothetical protein
MAKKKILLVRILIRIKDHYFDRNSIDSKLNYRDIVLLL